MNASGKLQERTDRSDVSGIFMESRICEWVKETSVSKHVRVITRHSGNSQSTIFLNSKTQR